MKKILIYTNHFYPESFKINDLAFELAKAGKDITVITGIPNYPTGSFFKGYGFFKNRKESINNLNIIRLPLIARGNGSKFRLLLNYVSFALSAIIHSFYIAFFKRYDVIIVHHTTPIFISIPSIIVKRIQKIPLIFWNLDLWPEIVVANTGIRHPFFFNNILNLVKWINTHVDVMLIGSKGYEKPMIERNIPKNKIIYFPNWAENIFYDNKYKDLNIPVNMPNGFNIVYAGNIGNSQDFEHVIKAIVLTRDEAINWIIVGNGRKFTWLNKEIERLDLTHKVILTGHLAAEFMPALYRKADALFASLVDEPIFTLPLKITTYLTAGKPILTMMNGEGYQLIKELNCGLSCLAGDYIGLAENAKKLASMSKEELEMIGNNATSYSNQTFNPKVAITKLSNILDKITSQKL